MPNCEACQAQLLEYVYDLLDDGDRPALQAHLEGCAACQAALVKARTQQQLLAAAAKLDCSAVTFQPPPAEAVTVTPSPATLPLASPAPARRRPWRRYAMAAAVLLALGGLGAPGAWFGSDILHARRAVREQENAVAQIRAEQQELQQRIARTETERNEKVKSIYDSLRQRELKLVVTGPATVQPGAPAEYQIAATNLNQQPTPAQVSVQVMDGGVKVGEPIQAAKINDGNYRVTLPPDLPLRPGSQPVLVVSAKRDLGVRTELSERLDLTAPVYLTHLTTDKPMYQPGEVVHFRSLTLDRATMKPAAQDLRFVYTITTPTGEVRPVLYAGNGLLRATADGGQAEIKGPDEKPLRGVGAGDYYLDPNTTPGGEYTLTVREELNRFAEQQRKFVVNRYQKPRLNKELDFSRKTYGAGEEVAAACKAISNDSGPLKNKRVEATVTIDDKRYGADGKPSDKPLVLETDAEGKVNVRFTLPKEIEKGQASLSVNFFDGGNAETITRPIPLVLKKLQVEFFPEGGDLIAGLQNRVYFSVRTTLGKPADLKGRIFEDGKPLDVEAATLNDEKEPGVNQGLGRFALTPKAGSKYELQIDTPVGIKDRVKLPDVKEEGVVLSVAEGVVGSSRPIKVTVKSQDKENQKRTLLVGAYLRGRLLDSVQLKEGQTEAELKPAGDAGGVCRITVFEEIGTGANRRELKPVAERLIYRQPAERVDLVIRPDRKSYVPGDKASLHIQAVTEKDEPAAAVVMVAVVDKSVLTLADEKTARSMPTHFLLTTEVRRPEDLEFADFLLGPQAKAKQALDLLLGTQGWRRFAEQDPAKFRETHKEEADRLLVTTGQSRYVTRDFFDEEVGGVEQEHNAKVAELAKERDEASQRASLAAAAPAYLAAQKKLDDYRNLWDKLRSLTLPLLGVLLATVALICLLLGLLREAARAVPYFAAAAVCAALLPVGFVAWLFVQQPTGGGAVNQMAKVNAPQGRWMERGDFARDKAAVREERDNMQFDEPAMAQGVPAPKRPGGRPLPPRADLADPGREVPADDILAKLDNGKDGKKNLDQGRPWNMDKPGRGFGGGDAKAKGGEGKAERGKDRDMMEKQLADGRLRPVAPGQPFGPPAAGMPFPDAGKDARRLRNGEQVMLQPLPPMVVREYAHARTSGMTPEMRSDFTETLYWHPVLVLADGKGDVSFELCDSVTTFQVTAFAHTLDGRLGAATATFDARLPFTLQPKLPIEVTSGDKIDVPLSVSNNTDEKRKVALKLREHLGLALVKGETDDQFDIAAGSALRRTYRFQPLIKEGEAALLFEGKTDPFAADMIRNTFRVVPEGFPFTGSHSDVLEGAAAKTVVLPETWVKGTLKCQVNVYPSTLADLQKGLESLLREPNGCFEQTSTSNYPNLLILDYLKESDQTKPEVEKRARELLGRGYQKLTSFECTNQGKQKKEGYEWFGGTAPAHEALTAYGLLQFRDMSRVQEVDQAMVKRTADYLMAQRDGKGGFKRNPRALDTFGRAPDHITNAYIVWSLTESGPDDDVTTELNALHEQAKASKDPYFLALVANSLINRSRRGEATDLLKKVAEAQKDDGHLDAEKTSITGSGGRDLQIETTALATLGWLKANDPTFTKNVTQAVKWIGQQRGGYGGFGSTQSTILALKALIAFTRANKKTPEAGELKLFVGDQEVGKLEFPAGASDTLTLPLNNAEEVLKAGPNKVRVEMTGKNVFPFTLTWSYSTLQPASADNCPVKLETRLAAGEAKEGDNVRLTVRLENRNDKAGQGMAVAIVGLPGGLTIPEDLKQLKDYLRQPADGERPLVSAFEIRGRELVLYWRDLAPGQKIEVPVDLTCRVPGEYSGPASRAYLYYNADLKHWVEPLKMNIAAK